MPVVTPYTGPGQYAGLAWIEANRAIDAMFGFGQFMLTDLMRDALAGSALGSTGIAADFARALDQTVRASKNQLANVHHGLGQLMQQETVDAYLDMRQNNPQARRLPAYRPPYGHPTLTRSKPRDSGGKLEAALRSPNFFWATHDGIGFGNIKELDRTARQWHRLNYGVRGGKGGPGAAPAKFDVHMLGLKVGKIGLRAEPSRRQMKMPLGVFMEGAFYPLSRKGYKTKGMYATVGINAWNFMDAGVAALARELGPAYRLQYDRWLRSSRSNMGPLSRALTVQAKVHPHRYR